MSSDAHSHDHDRTAAAKVVVPESHLRAWSERVLRVAGASDDAARTTAACLLDASRRGIDTHGIVLLASYVPELTAGLIDGRVRASVLVDRPGAALLDGNNGLGPPTAREAMALAVEKAGATGAGIVTVRHANHFGAASVYANQAALAGCLGLVMANGPAAMAPAGALAPLLSTNPIAIAAPPTETDALLPSLDMATTTVAQGKIYAAERRGEPIPDGWAIGPDGLATTDPAQALAGALLPFGGHKGFGLAFFVELFTGGLSDGALSCEIPRDGAPGTTSACFLAISLDALGATASFRSRLRRLLGAIHGAPRAPGVERFRAPGERSWRSATQRSTAIPLERDVHTLLQRLAREVGVPFEP